MAMQSILSSLKTIINDDFSCPICSGLCTDTVINSECGHRCCRKCINTRCCLLATPKTECPTCRVHIPTTISCHPNLHFDHIVSSSYYLKQEWSLCFDPLLFLDHSYTTNNHHATYNNVNSYSDHNRS
jgi:hypothetical protein